MPPKAGLSPPWMLSLSLPLPLSLPLSPSLSLSLSLSLSPPLARLGRLGACNRFKGMGCGKLLRARKIAARPAGHATR